MSEITRRDCLKGGLVAGAGALLAGAALTGCSGGKATEEAKETWSHEADVVVVGSGMGGFCAALAAQENGAKVIMVEINRHSGGGSSFCGGVLTAGATTELKTYDQRTHYACQNELAHNAYQTFYDVIPDWLEGMGADLVNPGKEGLYFCTLGSESSMGLYGCRPFFDSLETIFADNGGTLLFEMAAEHIMTDGTYANRITGLYCTDAAGSEVTIKAKAVILACGGYQADPELRQRYFGPDANMATIMAVPWNTGAGMKMAQELGASLQGAMGRFNGAMACALPAHELEEDPDSFISRSYDGNGKDSVYFCADERVDYYPTAAVLVNLDGKRFVDEGVAQHLLPQETAKQRFSTGVFISDAPGWEQYLNGETIKAARYTSRSIREIFEEVFVSEEVGGVIYEANSIEELADTMNATGIMTHNINKKNLLETIAEYNAAAEAGNSEALCPTHTPNAGPAQGTTFAPIVTPPFYAWPARPAIYGCHGGVAIDTNSQVLDKNRRPIPGLYAASPTAGGIMNGYYTGAMACASATGYLAGVAAAGAIASL